MHLAKTRRTCMYMGALNSLPWPLNRPTRADGEERFAHDCIGSHDGTLSNGVDLTPPVLLP